MPTDIARESAWRRRRRTLIGTLVLALLVLVMSGCGRPDVRVDVEPGEGPLVRDRSQRVERVVLDPDTGDLFVQFVGGRPGDPITELCAAAYELEVGSPDNDQVRVSLWQMKPTVAPTFPELYGCDDAGHGYELAEALTSEQIDTVDTSGRVFDVAAEASVLVIVEGEVLVPGVVEGWEPQPGASPQRAGVTSWSFVRGRDRIVISADRFEGSADDALDEWRNRRGMPEAVDGATGETAVPTRLPLAFTPSIEDVLLADGTPAVIEAWSEEADLANLVFFSGRFRYTVHATGVVTRNELEAFANSMN